MKKLIWTYYDKPFESKWVSGKFVIDFIDGDGEPNSYHLTYGNRKIEYFSKLSSAKKVAQLISNA